MSRASTILVKGHTFGYSIKYTLADGNNIDYSVPGYHNCFNPNNEESVDTLHDCLIYNGFNELSANVVINLMKETVGKGLYITVNCHNGLIEPSVSY